MIRSVRLAVVVLAALAVAALCAPLAAAEIPPLTDGEISTFVAIQKALVADAGRAAEFCSVELAEREEDDGESVPDPDGSRLGRELEAHPDFGPLLRRHSIGGKRFAQVAVQIFAQALGLAMVDSLDDAARRSGKPATNRADYLSKSPDARLVSGRMAELTAVMNEYQKLCGDGGDDGDGGGEEDPEAEQETEGS